MTIPATTRNAERPLYVWAALAAMVIVFAGFARTFYLKAIFDPSSLSVLLATHGTVMTGWFVLFFVQVRLVASQRVAMHRKLGIFGAALAMLVLILGVATAITAVRLGHVPPGGPPPRIFLAVPLGDMLVFACLVGAGLLLRMAVADRGERGGQHHAAHAGIARGAQHAQCAVARGDDQFVLVLRDRFRERRGDVQHEIAAGSRFLPAFAGSQVGGEEAQAFAGIGAVRAQQFAHAGFAAGVAHGGAHLVPGLQQLQQRMAADEAGTAGDEYVGHACLVGKLRYRQRSVQAPRRVGCNRSLRELPAIR